MSHPFQIDKNFVARTTDYACVCGRTRQARVIALDMRVWSGTEKRVYLSPKKSISFEREDVLFLCG